jgi:hypothetical protein
VHLPQRRVCGGVAAARAAGADPRDLLLEKVVREPAGPVAEAVTVVKVNYDEETDVEYDTVTILPEGIVVAVRDIH